MTTVQEKIVTLEEPILLNHSYNSGGYTIHRAVERGGGLDEARGVCADIKRLYRTESNIYDLRNLKKEQARALIGGSYLCTRCFDTSYKIYDIIERYFEQTLL